MNSERSGVATHDSRLLRLDRVIPLLSAAAWIAIAMPGQAATASPGAIHLRSRLIDPRFEPEHPFGLARAQGAAPALQAAGTQAPAQAPGVQAPIHVLAQVEGRMSPDRKAEIQDAGLELAGAIPVQGYVAALRPGADRERLRALGVTWIGDLTPADKLSPTLVALTAAARGSAAPGSSPALLADGKVAVYVEWHRDVAEPAALSAIGAAGGAPLGSVALLGGALVAVPIERIPDLAALDPIKWIEAASPALRELNDGIRAATGVNAVFAAPLGLDGQGVTALIYDGGLACASQLDLMGRVTHGENGATATHATHVAGTFGGSGTYSNGLHRGMAPEAEILSYAYESCTPMCLYNNPQDMAEDYADGLNLRGADFASNSIGANIASNGYDCALLGDYEYTARLIDAIAYGGLGRPFLSFWAAGNERAGAARCGSGFGTTGVPAAAKSAIVVGASMTDANGIASFSSLGPVDDGRMRPDLVAPGCEAAGDHGITSIRSCTGEAVLCGTSMATPAVAGIAALVKERLRSSPRGDVSLPATMKAILGASALDRGNAGPDYTFGYGQVDAVAAIELVDSGTIFEGVSEAGETVTQWLEVPPGRPRLRVLLAWDDPPGEPFANMNLVNDLDLRLVDPMGGIHLPFVLDPSNPGSVAARGVNERDPSELVEVSAPMAGRWRIEIMGNAVPIGPQSFGVAADAPVSATTAVGAGSATPSFLNHLAPNVPNPFNPTTRIRFRLAGAGPARVAVYDLRGAEVRELVAGNLQAGWHAVTWDGRDERGRQVASGVYRCVLKAGRESLSQPMVLLK